MSNSEISSSNQERQKRSTGNVIFDLDGVMLRWVNTDLPNSGEQSAMLQELHLAQEKGLNVFALTNRPPGQMPILAYTLGVNYGYWVTESGGSIYDVHNHRAYVNPQWAEFASTKVKQLRNFLTENAGISDVPSSPNQPQFEPGMGFVKTVIIPPIGTTPQEYGEKIKEVLKLSGLEENFVVEIGKAIDIDPRGLSKSDGMRMLLEINGIDPRQTPTLFIADNKRDIPAAHVLEEAGGIVAAVGNSSPEYIQAVRDANGIVASSDTSYHSSVRQILRQFLND